MPVRRLSLRAASYLRAHGLKGSLKRVWREGKNQLLHRRLVIFRADLVDGEFDDHPMPDRFHVDRYDAATEVPEGLIRRTSEYYSEELLRENIDKRFGLGAALWVLRSDAEDLGYFWTIAGRTMQPQYFFPLEARDVHLDDALIFPPFRGRGLLPILTEEILRSHKREGFRRGYMEAAEWNAPMIKSVAKMGFTRIGLGRMKSRRGTYRVTWWR